MHEKLEIEEVASAEGTYVKIKTNELCKDPDFGYHNKYFFAKEIVSHGIDRNSTGYQLFLHSGEKISFLTAQVSVLKASTQTENPTVEQIDSFFLKATGKIL